MSDKMNVRYSYLRFELVRGRGASDGSHGVAFLPSQTSFISTFLDVCGRG